MDAIELLSELGRVERADQVVLDEALCRFSQSQFTEAAGQGRRPGRVGAADPILLDTTSAPRGRWTNRQSRLLIAAAGAVAVAAAGVAVLPGVTRPLTPAPSTPAPSTPARPAPSRSGIAAILTAFEASRSDILMVTKTMSGPDGSLGETIIWVDPVGAAPGTAVRSRILDFTLAGARLTDQALSYTAPRSVAADCDQVFMRPKVDLLPAAGVPGTATIVYNPERFWVKAKVAVKAPTVPSASSLRTCLKAGQWRDLGPRVIDGTKVTEFAEVTKLPPSGASFEHLWVDRTTDLPVRLVSSDGQEMIAFGFRFLPPTPANQALLRPRIPVGFVKRGI
jgi:hypothetical protein